MPLNSWVEIPFDSDFTLVNLPYGVFSSDGRSPRVGIAIGNYILDLQAVAELNFFNEPNLPPFVFAQPTLNEFMALGRPVWQAVRRQLTELLQSDFPEKERLIPLLVPQAEAVLHLPVRVGDYTDFYASEYHATNVGKLFRPDQPLMPNWKHLPVAYHGRTSSVVVSGTDFRRPNGQALPAGADTPEFGPSKALDFELEMAAVVGRDSVLGEAVSIADAEGFIFGFVLLNDWSARDIQRWEYQPLGPFLGKNFCTSISPWVVPLDALTPFRVAGPVQEPPVLPYLHPQESTHFDVALEVLLGGSTFENQSISQSNLKYLYWSFAQMLAHHTVNGCPLRVGDLLGSGTISGPTSDSLGCLLEMTQGGKIPLVLPNGLQRRYLEDGDRVMLRGFAGEGSNRVGFGEVTGKVLGLRV
ncbi:MAG: fumarylacetoacetase [Cytophagaceae bacterium]|nr:fumarylacetoacetase [Cytophagaceae bacterium]